MKDASATRNARRPRSGKSRAAVAVVCALAALFFAQSLSASLQKSATFDEPMHITAGLSYLGTGRIVISPDHPPLLKELSAAVLQLARIHWPATPEAAALIDREVRFPQALARSVVVDNGPDRVLFWARLPLIFLNTALVFGVYMLGRRLAGTIAGVAAAFLCAFDPNTVAHSFLVTTDLGVTTLLVLFMVALWDYIDRPGPVHVVGSGVALGAALGAKYSAVILPPIAAFLLLAAVRWPPAGAQSLAKGPASKQKAEPVTVDLLRRYAIAFVAMCVVAFVVLQIIYLFPHDPLQYIAGWRAIYGGPVQGFEGYMAGRLAPRFYSYYIVAFLLKEPIATIALVVIGLWLAIKGANLPPLNRAFLLLPPILIVAGYTVMSFNIGIRYLLPALPFAHVLGGLAIARLVESVRTTARVVAVLACGWVVLAAAGIYPDSLSYFNEAACLFTDPSRLGLDGGSRCGPMWLDDSNVDWGQGLKQLKTWLDRNAPGREVRLGYFGTVPPEAYGLKELPMSDDDILRGTSPGLYAVSAHIVASTPAVAKQMRGGGAEWLRQTRPIAIVGHAYYIFEIPDRQPSR
ncbi:MAG TPA: glycosyltransferase family 39 protein [Gemmatimonadaceae bacterium]|nr:glycosyltransferase family 39 protein [Gemmatimonadaceae bacterium]